MKRILTAATTAALLTGFAATAYAGAPGLNDGDFFVVSPIPPLQQEVAPKTTASLPTGATIAVARLDGGRLIPTPFAEAFDWELLARRTGANIEPLSAGAALDYVPEIAFQGVDTDNKIDEIRLAAVGEGYSHVILYGVGPDARWSSFGGKALAETGLSVDEDCRSWDGAKAKALLVDAYTGDVLGAAVADDITHNIGKLADDMERVMGTLASTT